MFGPLNSVGNEQLNHVIMTDQLLFTALSQPARQRLGILDSCVYVCLCGRGKETCCSIFVHLHFPILGQYSSETDPGDAPLSQKTSVESDAPSLRRVITEGSLASVTSMRSESRLKALMRDELLINAQKFASQVIGSTKFLNRFLSRK